MINAFEVYTCTGITMYSFIAASFCTSSVYFLEAEIQRIKSVLR